MGKTEIKSHMRIAQIQLALLCAGLLALACSGEAGAPSGGGQLAPGDTRFLIARGSALEEVTLSGQETRLFELQDKSYVLQPSLSPDGRSLAFI
ncbi:MAG TPA: hypothetical protein VI876_08515, partial [Dehalococcoidia bacterium]|nr:hypothetical protein [Dehalococcoidia bacterium]